MGLISTILGAGGAARQVGEAVGGVAEVFVGNRAARDEAASQQYLAAVGAYGAEFAAPATRPVRPLRQRAEPPAAADAGARHPRALRLCDGGARRLLDPDAGARAGARAALVAARRHRLLLLRRPRAASPAEPPGDRPARRAGRRRRRWRRLLRPAPMPSTPSTTPRSRSGAACAGESRAAGGARGPKPSRQPLRISMRLQSYQTEDPDAQVLRPTRRHRHRPRCPNRDVGRGCPARPGGNHGFRGRLAPVMASVAGRFGPATASRTRGLKPSRPPLRMPHQPRRHRHRPRRHGRDPGRVRPARPGGNSRDRGRLAVARSARALRPSATKPS